MPHIHTAPDQHDMTVSMYIVREVEGTWKCLVHMHRKLGVLMQAGGHIELNETPWQSVEHELREETGYELSELKVLQSQEKRTVPGAIVHPVPFLVNTHTAGKGPHYHSDLCYAFIADSLPLQPQSDGESEDLRWLSVEEMKQLASDTVLDDVIAIYEIILCEVGQYHKIPAEEFSLEKPMDYNHFA